MEQKLAGFGQPPDPSRWPATRCRRRATAEPPDEPAQERDVSQGLSVRPKTSLKVFAPAPNSGVLDLA